MKLLGISAFYHDASAAIIADGQVVAAAAEERFTLQRHDSNFPSHAANFCLRQAGIPAQELDGIFFYEQPHTKFSRVFSSALAGYPRSRASFVKSMRTWLTSKLWIKNSISSRLNVHPKRIHFAVHHESHAAQAFLGSPFEQAAVLVVDSVGEWGSTSLYEASRGASPMFKPIAAINYPDSLGLVYSAFTAFLGFRVNDGESSTMALAAFGRPAYAEAVRKIVRIQLDGTYCIDQSYFCFDDFARIPLSQKFYDVFGPPRNGKSRLAFDCLAENRGVSSDDQRYADIAASIQVVFVESLLALCRKLRSATNSNNLCFAGGTALNCVANSKVLESSGFDNIFIPPDPGDGGAAIGAACLGHSALAPGIPVSPLPGPFLGAAYDATLDLEMLSHCHPEQWEHHRMIATTGRHGHSVTVEHYDDEYSLLDRVVDDLTAGLIIGWVQGRFENGPRALGNRSILIDPRRIDVANHLSRHVKSRAPFRPYALSFSVETAPSALGPGKPLQKWMQSATKVDETARELLRAGCHVDGTTRPQVCSRDENAKYNALINRFHEATGVPGILNTSFNPGGYPLVASPIDALVMFARTDMDAVVINDSIVRKG